MLNWFLIIMLVIIVLIVVVVIANHLFQQNANKEVSRLLNNIPELKNDYLQKEDLAGVPAPVQRWLESSNIIGKERIASVRLKQKGRMRMTIDGPWMEASAEQYFRVDSTSRALLIEVKQLPICLRTWSTLF